METEKPLKCSRHSSKYSRVIVFCILTLGVDVMVSAAAQHKAKAAQHKTTQAHFACVNEDEYEGLLIMAAGTDPSTRAAFQDELVKATLADKCTTFFAGEEVNVITTHVREPDPLLGGQRLSLTKISFKGRGKGQWWTSPTVIR